jgi:iron(III) transport system ATP-binding protein
MLLLDEPTSSVDPTTARDVIGLLAEINREQATTILHVTHDQEQALELAHRVFVMAEGRILQSGTPEDVYSRPADLAVARFIGEGGLIQATLNGDLADTPLGSMPVDGAGLEGPVWVLLRPEHLQETSPGDGIPATTERVSYRGGDYLAHVRVADVRLAVPLSRRVLPGETIRLRVVGVPRAVEARR